MCQRIKVKEGLSFRTADKDLKFKLQPAIFPLSQHVVRFHELSADTTQRFLE